MSETLPYNNCFRLVWTPFLKKRKGKMHQAVGVICPPVLGSGGELTLKIGRETLRAQPIDLLRYPIGTRHQDHDAMYLWEVPRPARAATCTARWKTPLGTTYRASLKLKPANPIDIHLVFKTHLDLGYTHPVDDVIRLYQTTFMDRLLENLDATADRKPAHRFVWTLSTWLLEQCLDPKAVKAEHRQRLEKYIRSGQVVWGLQPFTTHSEFFGFEEMCRSLYAARRLAERFDRPVPRAAKMTDVPGHTAALAMAFASAGGNFFQIGTNPESRMPHVPPLFWWELPDEQRILVHYHGAYGTPLLPPDDWAYDHWLAIQITSDNVGPQGLALLDHVAWIERHFDAPVCRTGPLESFADAIIKRHGKALPKVEKEFTDWWIHGIASQARHTATAREDKERLPDIEALATATGWANGKEIPKDIRETVGRAYDQLALYTEHTWGDHATDMRTALPKGNLYTSNVFAASSKRTLHDGTTSKSRGLQPARSSATSGDMDHVLPAHSKLPPVDRWEASWQDKANYAVQARKLTDQAEQQAWSNAFNVKTTKSDRLGIVLFNALGWARGGLVRLSTTDLPKGAFELIDPTTGGTVLYDRTADGIEFIAPKVPPCGYLVLEVRPVGRQHEAGLFAEWYKPQLTVHTNEYSLQFHEKGGMARWHDRARSHQWCSGKAEFPLGTYLYEMPGGEKLQKFARAVHSNGYPETPGFFHRREYSDMSQFGPVGGDRAKVTPHITPLAARVVVEATCPTRKPANRRSGDARRYRSTFSYYRGSRDVHVRIELLGKRPTYAAEAGYAVFPFAGEDPTVFVHRTAHLLQPGDELAPGVNAAHMAVGHGVRIESDHAGISFYPLHTPLLSFGQPGAYAYDEDGEYETGEVYATLFNNCWGTNFAQWQSGDFAFDFVCRPSGNDDWDSGLANGGAEVFRPLRAKVVKFPSEAPSRSIAAIEDKAVELVALKPADFGPGVVLRLWNSSADDLRTHVTIPGTSRTDEVFPCDLLERPTGKKLPRDANGRVALPIKAGQIRTLWCKPTRGMR